MLSEKYNTTYKTSNPIMMKAFILDKERVLDSINDLLKTVICTESLVGEITNTPKTRLSHGDFGKYRTCV